VKFEVLDSIGVFSGYGVKPSETPFERKAGQVLLRVYSFASNILF